jgi:hypothetical protein
MQLPDPKHFLGGPLLRIAPDGKTTLRFSLESTAELADASVSDFAIGPSGEVYLLLSRPNDSQYLARFDKAARFVSKTRLDKDFELTRFGLFASGDFLATGRDAAASASGSNLAAETVILDSQGQLLRKVELPGDVTPRSVPTDTKTSSYDKNYARTVLGSFIESSDDGNAYLGRRSPAGPIYIISPGGEVIRRISLKPPDNAELTDIRVSHGRLAAMFLQRTNKPSASISRVIFSIIDVHTSETIAEFAHSSAQLGAALGCYVPDEFTFVTTTSDDMLQIARARAH